MGEERLPLPPAVAGNHLALYTRNINNNTYVIQIPRDQVYRVPNAENARIIENHIKEAQEQKKRRCGPVCWIIIVLLLLAIVAFVAILIVRATLYNPKSPEFSVIHVHTKNLDSNKKTTPPQYDILLRTNNPNKLISVSFRGPGKAILIFNEEELGKGGMPRGTTTIKEEPGTLVDFPLILSGEGLSPSNTKSLNETKEIQAVNLKIEIPMEVNSWLKNDKMDLTVTCDVKLQNSLVMNKARISSQQCQAKF